MDAVCFGTLARRNIESRASIQEFLNSIPDEALKIFDINLRLDFFNDEVVDTVGAGDSFAACMCWGILNQLPLSHINYAANRIAAFVCSQSGATPRLPQGLIADLSTPG